MEQNLHTRHYMCVLIVALLCKGVERGEGLTLMVKTTAASERTSEAAELHAKSSLSRRNNLDVDVVAGQGLCSVQAQPAGPALALYGHAKGDGRFGDQGWGDERLHSRFLSFWWLDGRSGWAAATRGWPALP